MVEALLRITRSRLPARFSTCLRASVVKNEIARLTILTRASLSSFFSRDLTAAQHLTDIAKRASGQLPIAIC